MGKSGHIDGELVALKRLARNSAEAVVLQTATTDDFLQAELELKPSGDVVWADVLMSAGVGGGARPVEGDRGAVLMIDGDRNRAMWLGWLSGPGAKAPEHDPGVRFLDGGGEYDVVLKNDDGTVRVSTDGAIKVEGVDGTVFEIPAGGGFKLERNGIDLIENIDSTQGVVKSILDALTSSVVATTLGPQPLSNAGVFATLRTQLETISQALKSLKD